jgi:A/G-specific adenine glycosylase
MLQQTQVSTVVPYYNEWLRRFPSFSALARASENDVLRAWEGLGYYARARNLHAAAKLVRDRHRGGLPSDIDRMHELPGVGRYIAHAVATFAFDQPVPVVEANTARVLSRLFNLQEPIDRTAGRHALWTSAASLLPRNSARIYNSALIDLGALICLPRPNCGICPVHKFCRATNPENLPAKRPRPQTHALVENHLFISGNNQILLQQARHRWRGMWILPRLNESSTATHPSYSAVFPFTHHRVTLNVFAHRDRNIDNYAARWFGADSLDAIPVPTPHRRAIASLLSHQRRNVEG